MLSRPQPLLPHPLCCLLLLHLTCSTCGPRDAGPSSACGTRHAGSARASGPRHAGSTRASGPAQQHINEAEAAGSHVRSHSCCVIVCSAVATNCARQQPSRACLTPSAWVHVPYLWAPSRSSHQLQLGLQTTTSVSSSSRQESAVQQRRCHAPVGPVAPGSPFAPASPVGPEQTGAPCTIDRKQGKAFRRRMCFVCMWEHCQYCQHPIMHKHNKAAAVAAELEDSQM